MDIHGIAEKMMVDIITPEFLESVERWARFKGKSFDIGDMDVIVENKGEFKRTTQLPKFKIVDGKMTFGENRDHHTYYDVTSIRNIARCTDNNTIIIIAQRLPKLLDTEEFRNSNPSELFIYSISDKSDDAQYTIQPSFERLKSDFENSVCTQYHSLIRNFCGRYSLSTYNDKSDRIFSITAISSDLDWLENSAKKKVSRIKVAQRLANVTNCDRDDLRKSLIK